MQRHEGFNPAPLPPPRHHYHRATLVQSDLIGFTRMASLKPPEAVVKAVSVPSLGWPGCRREVSRAERRSSGVCAELQPAAAGFGSHHVPSSGWFGRSWMNLDDGYKYARTFQGKGSH